VGQGDPGGQHQGGVIRAIPAEYSITFRSANGRSSARTGDEMAMLFCCGA
jgi:hypothetical protein